GAHSAVHVVNGCMEPAPCHGGEHRVAPDPVEHGHRARLHGATTALQAASLHEFISLAEFGQEARRLCEVIAIVSVPHQDVLAAGRRESAHERAAVALFCYRHDPRAELGGDVLRAVSAAVVGDDDFAGDAVLGERALCADDARLDGVRLVEAGHDDAELSAGDKRYSCGPWLCAVASTGHIQFTCFSFTRSKGENCNA